MIRYLSLAEFWYLAEHVTGINAATLIKASRVELADSALHAPQAGFGDTDFYPDPHDKAAVLACRIAWNHPLPDGNKRAAYDYDAVRMRLIEADGIEPTRYWPRELFESTQPR